MEPDPDSIYQYIFILQHTDVTAIPIFHFLLFVFGMSIIENPESNYFNKQLSKISKIFKPKPEPIVVYHNPNNQAAALKDDLQEQHILKGIERFGDVTVSQIMKARIDAVYLDKSLSFSEIVSKFRTSGYSRIPITNGSFDKVEGIVNVKDLLYFFEHYDERESWNTMVKPDVLYVPEGKFINHMLQQFQQEKKHMAIVVDEYGVCIGLITMEDILEEIFGEINDESDVDEEIFYRKIDDQNYLFLGKTLIVDVCKIMGIDSDLLEEVRGSAESIAGLMLENLERLPVKGEEIDLANIRLAVQAVDKRRILRIKVTNLNPVN